MDPTRAIESGDRESGTESVILAVGPVAVPEHAIHVSLVVTDRAGQTRVFPVVATSPLFPNHHYPNPVILSGGRSSGGSPRSGPVSVVVDEPVVVVPVQFVQLSGVLDAACFEFVATDSAPVNRSSVSHGRPLILSLDSGVGKPEGRVSRCSAGSACWPPRTESWPPAVRYRRPNGPWPRPDRRSSYLPLPPSPGR